MGARVALVAILWAASPAFADDGLGTGSASTPTVNVAGYVEAFYQYNFNRPSNLVTAYRAFDDRTNSFTIANAVLDVTGKLDKVFTRLALQIGHSGAAYYSAEPTSGSQGGVGASDASLWRYIQQAIVGYKPTDELTLEGGIFLATIGIEGLAIKDQWNWSRAQLFNALPFYHAGARATYVIDDDFTLVGMVTNGWNDVVNRNPYPCFELMLQFSPGDRVAGQVLYFGGVERPTGSPEGQPWRHLLDATVTVTVTDELAVAAEADAGFEANAFGTQSWVDGALYARVKLADPLHLAARGDLIYERIPAGASAMFFPEHDVQSATLTADYRPAPNLAVMLEYRLDHASGPMFYKGDVAVDMAGLDIPTASSQQTLTLGATSWF